MFSPVSIAVAIGLATSTVLASESLQVDLGYATYQGTRNDDGTNAWNGMRYASPPTGSQRWRAPKPPPNLGSAVIPAVTYAPHCPQVFEAGTQGLAYEGNEDCLYLDVVAPLNAHNLPVLVYIHGGGYGSGGAGFNFSVYMTATNYSFVGVDIQYRLGAFGFLASQEVHDNGALNAGLLDQHMALEWIQEHISKFGGNPRSVTLLGQSAGGGSIINQAMARGGSEGTRYFTQGFAASPYTPSQFQYSDPRPEYYYEQFAIASGCAHPATGSRLDCLRAADTQALQFANNASSGSTTIYGTWAFTPVIDGDFLRELPSQQLPLGLVNGNVMVTGNNADEAPQFIAPNITTAEDFNQFLRYEYPMLTEFDIAAINLVYPYQNQTPYNFATCGDCGPEAATAVNTGSYAVGHQQRAVNLYSELTFICPSYWLASGYDSQLNLFRRGYKYQYSVPPSAHGDDNNADGFNAYPNYASGNIGPDLHTAFVQMIANTVTHRNPSISNQLANGASSENPDAPNPISNWPQWHVPSRHFININETSNATAQGIFFDIGGYRAPQVPIGPGLRNQFTLAEGTTFEQGRGLRCDFWRTIAGRSRV